MEIRASPAILKISDTAAWMLSSRPRSCLSNIMMPIQASMSGCTRSANTSPTSAPASSTTKNNESLGINQRPKDSIVPHCGCHARGTC